MFIQSQLTWRSKKLPISSQSGLELTMTEKRMRKAWLGLACLVAVALAASPMEAHGSDPITKSPPRPMSEAWVDSLRATGIALPSRQLLALHRNPICVVEKVGSPAHRYDELLKAIKQKRRELLDRYRNASTPSDRQEVVEETRQHVGAIIVKLLFPLWLGIDWDFYGVPGRVPDARKPVACGHLIQKLLVDAGFVLRQRAGTQLAYLAPEDFVESLQGSEPEDLRTWDAVQEYLQAHGSGLYFLGLEAGWGHVLMGDYSEQGQFWLMHSGPHPRGAGVSIDEAKHYLNVFETWEHIWMTPLDSNLTVKWLEGAGIVPCVVMD